MTYPHPLAAFLRLAQDAPDAPMAIQGEKTWSRGDILGLSGALSSALSARGIGNQPEQRVMIVLPNSAHMIAMLPAIWSMGALPMFLSAKATASQRAKVEAFYKPDLVIDQPLLDALVAAPGELGAFRPEPHDDASVVFTSGSTGLPKGVVQKGGTLSAGVDRVARTLGYSKTERILVPIPFAHDYGWGQMLSALVGGHVLILPERDILQDIPRAINAHRPTVLAGVPSLYSGLLFGISGFETADTSCLRLMTSTGSAFSAQLIAALEARVPQAQVLLNYGLTETYRSCTLLPDDAGRYPGSIGRPIEGVELRIVDDSATPLPPGAEGEIVHLGAGTFDRYLDDPEATARARRILDGQHAVFTGDVGVLNADGFLTLLGRRDRLVKSQDVRISLTDVEEALCALEGVAEAAVLARQHDIHGTEMIAFVVPEGEASIREIRRNTNRGLPPHMRPRHFHERNALPRTPVGKVDYPSLKSELPDG